MTSADIELAIWLYWGRTNNKVIVPNVSWGMFNHELDLLILEKDNSITEIEIKISKSDVKADLKKPHKHFDKKIHKLYFAIPEDLNKPDVLELIPEHAGVIVVYPKSIGVKRVVVTKRPKPNTSKYICTISDIRTIAYLAQFRTWKARVELSKLKTKIKNKGQLKLV